MAFAAGDVAPGRRVGPDPAVRERGVEATFEAARYEFDSGNYGAAERMLKAFLAQFPNDRRGGDARAMLGRIAARKIRQMPRYGLGMPPAKDRVSADLPNLPITRGWKPRVSRVLQPQHKLVFNAGDRVFFAPGSAALGATARRVLHAQARWLKVHPGFGFEIIGHSDEPGSSIDNLVLSLQRAEAVRQRLIAEGVGRARLRVIGRGRTQRIAVCSSAGCKAQNRRVRSWVRRWSAASGLDHRTVRR